MCKIPFSTKLSCFIAGVAVMGVIGYYQLAIDLTGISRQIHSRINDLSSSVKSLEDVNLKEMEILSKRLKVLEDLKGVNEEGIDVKKEVGGCQEVQDLNGDNGEKKTD